MATSERVKTTTNFTNYTDKKDSVFVAEKDTLKEITVITINTNEKGDTVKVSTVTDRTRARSRDAIAKQQTKEVVRTDTVYIERKDSVLVKSEKLKVKSELERLGRIIVENGRFDQLIYYPTFVHVSWKRVGTNRKQVLRHS